MCVGAYVRNFVSVVVLYQPRKCVLYSYFADKETEVWKS